MIAIQSVFDLSSKCDYGKVPLFKCSRVHSLLLEEAASPIRLTLRLTSKAGFL